MKGWVVALACIPVFTQLPTTTADDDPLGPILGRCEGIGLLESPPQDWLFSADAMSGFAFGDTARGWFLRERNYDSDGLLGYYMTGEADVLRRCITVEKAEGWAQEWLAAILHNVPDEVPRDIFPGLNPPSCTLQLCP